MNYKQAIQYIVTRRKNDLLLAEQRLLSALRQNEELKAIYIEIETLRQARRKGQQVDMDRLSALIASKDKILSTLQLNPTPSPRCAKCEDTGLSGGKPCACVIAMTNASEAHEQATFEACDFSVFDQSDRDSARQVYSALSGFCDRFPTKNKLNFILLGGTGTGKTYLASCVANKLSQSGFSVMFVTAFGFVNRMLNYHTAPVEEKLDYLLPLIDCDLLVIDDLGTESRLKNITVEYLYSILNERMRLKKHTLITTNFDEDMLAQRYGERVYSRLFDKRTSSQYVIAEKDVRKL